MRILQINREIKAPSGVLAGGGWGAKNILLFVPKGANFAPQKTK